MKTKKFLSIILASTIFACTLATVSASSLEEKAMVQLVSIQDESVIMPIKQENEDQVQFAAFTGVVKEITDHHSLKGAKFLLTESKDGQIANIIFSNSTYVLDNASIKVGSEIMAFYDMNAPMIMIYPPQYNARVIAVSSNNQMVKVDFFDKNLLSGDQSLKLNVGESTEVITEEGKTFKGDLTNRHLVVVYEFMTKSIPAQTTPIKVIVLSDKKVDLYKGEKKFSTMDLIINDKKMKTIPVLIQEEKVMIPVRVIAEALGNEVSWDRKTKGVQIGKAISLVIDKDYYSYMKMAPIELGMAPMLIKDITYVPLEFFQRVMRLSSVQLMEEQIVIRD